MGRTRYGRFYCDSGFKKQVPIGDGEVLKFEEQGLAPSGG